MTSSRRLEAVYELTVVGMLGPVLRAMVEPVMMPTSCELQTTICVRRHDGEDLVDILQMLRTLGLEVESINTIPDQGPRGTTNGNLPARGQR